MRRVTLAVFSILIGFHGKLVAGIIYENALPNIFLNQIAGSLRSNIAFTESDPLHNFDGTQVVFSEAKLGGNTVTVNSVTAWSVASAIGDPLGLEFSNVSLYFRPEGGTWQIAKDAQGRDETGKPDTFFSASNPNLDLYDNPDIKSTEVPYRRDVAAYQSTDAATPDVYYPLWENSFSNLNLTLSTGVNYEFAVWGTNPNPDPTTLYGYWFNHYSNAFLSGARADNFSGSYLRCDAVNLSAPCFVENPFKDQTFDKGANFNIQIDGTVSNTAPVPEPSSLAMSVCALCGMTVAFLRKRQTRVSDSHSD